MKATANLPTAGSTNEQERLSLMYCKCCQVSASLQPLLPQNPIAEESEEIVVQLFCTIAFCHFLYQTKGSNFAELLADIQHVSYLRFYQLPWNLKFYINIGL